MAKRIGAVTPHAVTYKNIVACGIVLPEKAKYTMRDVNSLVEGSLFARYTYKNAIESLLGSKRALTEDEAKIIVRSSALFHGTLCSAAVNSKRSSTFWG